MTRTGKMGFRIVTDVARPDPQLVEQIRGVDASNLADAMGRFNFMDPGIVSRSGLRLGGVAVTVNCRPADNLMVHKALDIAHPGDIVVVSTNGNVTSSVFGELMCHSAVAARLGGIVVDGAIRDIAGIKRLGFPAFSRVVSPGSCDKDGPGEINVPISCGGTVVQPGDVVVGDDDGVVVVPRGELAEVLVLVNELMQREKKRIEAINDGIVFKPDIDESLRGKGVID